MPCFWSSGQISTEAGGTAFREQDLADLPIGDAVEYGRYFGRLHIHPTSGAPHGYPEVHLVHRGVDGKGLRTYSSQYRRLKKGARHYRPRLLRRAYDVYGLAQRCHVRATTARNDFLVCLGWSDSRRRHRLQQHGCGI